MALEVTPVYRNLRTRVTFFGLEAEDLFAILALAVVANIADRVAVMYLGRIVEYGPAAQIYADPKHPYTQSLLKAIPEPDPTKSVPRDLPRGEIPDAALPPMGCSSHPRCRKASAICGWETQLGTRIWSRSES